MLNPIDTELTTAATDLILAGFAFGYAITLKTKRVDKKVRSILWRSIFILTALGALLGCIVHGLLIPKWLDSLLWLSIFLCLDVSIVLFAIAVIYDYWKKVKGLPVLITTALISYLILVSYKIFVVFIVYQLVVMLSALFIYGYLASSHQLKGAAYLCFGISIMVFGAFLQLFPTAQFRWIWTFNHNGVYHLVSILGLSLIFIGIREDFNEKPKGGME